MVGSGPPSSEQRWDKSSKGDSNGSFRVSCKGPQMPPLGGELSSAFHSGLSRINFKPAVPGLEVLSWEMELVRF